MTIRTLLAPFACRIAQRVPMLLLATTPALAVEPAPAGIEPAQWHAITKQIADDVDDDIVAGEGVVRGGSGDHGLVRTAVVTGEFGMLPEQNGPNGPEFGHSVALDGDWLAVGAPGTISHGGELGLGAHGAVFMFQRQHGAWQFMQRVITHGPGSAVRCGHSVALALPHLAFGCPGHGLPSSPNGEHGAMRMFRLSTNGVWDSISGTAVSAEGSRCGTSVSLAPTHTATGTTRAAFGCPGYNLSRGLVQTYHYDSTDWGPADALSASDSVAGDHFGASVALYRNSAGPVIVQRLAVGAPEKAHAPAFGAGSVYVFEGPDWTQTATFTHASPQTFSATFFGGALAMNNTQLIVGIPGGFTTECGNAPRCGLVRRYERSGGTWQPQESGGTINTGGNPPGEQPGMRFGGAVALGFDNWTAVAAPLADGWTQFDGLAEDIGMVELRRNNGGGYGVTWSDHHGEVGPGTIGALAHDEGRFGTSVDFGDRRLAVGYPRAGTLIGGRRGQVWIYETDIIFADGFD